MLACDYCHKKSLEASERVGLFVENGSGRFVFHTFHGTLCDECADRASHFKSPEYRWLLKQDAPVAHA
jgi:hypothetical protein